MYLTGIIKNSKLTVTMLLLANISVAQATSVMYTVEGVLNEPLKTSGGTVGDTIFSGTFEWDSLNSTMSNFSGVMNSSMYSMDQDISLAYNLESSLSGNVFTASVFKENTTNVFFGGGYKTGDYVKYGNVGDLDESGVQVLPNENAYFTFEFDITSMEGIVSTMVYGDCTPTGLMGVTCMTGIAPYINEKGQTVPGGTMMATPATYNISAVPIPAAVWLFGSALLGMVGVSRKRTLSV